MGFLDKFGYFISRKGTIKAWYGVVIIFFLVMIIVPTLFVLSYAITGWDDIQGDIFTVPAESTPQHIELVCVNRTLVFDTYDIIDITETTWLELDLPDTAVQVNYTIFETLDDGSVKSYYSVGHYFDVPDTYVILIHSNETHNEITHVGPVMQNITLRDVDGTYLDSWEGELYLRAGNAKPMDLIWDAMKISFIIATIVTIIDFIAGLPMAWLMVRKDFRGKKYLDILIDMPLAIPTAALGFSTALFWAVTPKIPGAGLGMTAIHVTHDQEEALTISDRIIMLKEGKIIQKGTPHEMFNRPASPFIHHFIGEANFIRGTVTARQGNSCSVTTERAGVFSAVGTDLKVGTKVVAGIKTEFTILEKEAKGHENQFSGIVDRKLFLGRFTDFEVIVEDGRIIHARLPSSLAHKFQEGSKVHVHYNPGRLLVFPEPERGLKAELEMM
ncbi:MAG: TOBE domain-containing protein [Candidatus Thermoplasmatota archaeon]|nr:TOBE domain-containing protein [Euryarchaeota archaeon]MBU4031624.1 TOBE domain-containing protein [Candidatus Thermoplasmatota archaeon]MBU4070790.1 TOBE domain-containing protein [Candidatus Thermoplasmatota archaeon]MBU4144944.1 TOBE domain-containing protein [Candidatus Thermoplasmatota archaeon]MBU4591699.1 TOBE domain-containing protein [Candidatus Thermoplasmatota archaeon]